MILTDLYALLRRDWQTARSYRFAFLLQYATILSPLLLFFFLVKVFGEVQIPAVEAYGGNYLNFMLVGVVVTTYAGTALTSFSSSLRRAQTTGTLEALLLTRTRLPVLIFGSALYPFLASTLMMLVYLVGGFLILGISFDNANLPVGLLTLVLLVIVMGSFGIVAASFTMAFKRGDPVTAFMVVVPSVLSGTVYPVSVLPAWLQAFSHLLPQTYAIEAMRLAMLQGASFNSLGPQLLALAIYGALFLPLAVWTFTYAMYRAKIEGSLAHY